jgi:hypothetical protein
MPLLVIGLGTPATPAGAVVGTPVRTARCCKGNDVWEMLVKNVF